MQRQFPIRRTRAEVDLDALAWNLSILRKRAGGVGIVLPVKADGYGHGQVAVARRAVDEGVELLAVANAQELLVLRAAGISHPTLLLEDLFEEELSFVLADQAARLNVSSYEYAQKISSIVTESTREGAAASAKLHVNVDTGMGRMGLLSDDPAETIGRVASLPGIEVEGVYSHFPAADEEDLSFAGAQLDAFRRILHELERRGIRPRYRHIANSAGILAFEHEGAFDLVRPGVSAYGMYPSEPLRRGIGRGLSLRPCMRLVSALIKVTEYDREWSIGYGRSYQVGPGSRIGVVPIGYGDGYRRAHSNNGFALVHGLRVPVVGRVSMDMITVDLTNLPEKADLGDEVILLGEQDWRERREQISAEEMAEQVGTISYEITCAFTPRVPRVYP